MVYYFIFFNYVFKIMSNKYKNISVISTGSWVPSFLNNSENTKGTYQVLINQLILNASIGIHEHEKLKKQRVAVSLSIQAAEKFSMVNESIENVVSYEEVIAKIKKITSKGHIELLETFGEKILEICFDDARVLSVWIKLEKLDVFDDAKSVGIEIFKDKNDFKDNQVKLSNIKRIKK